MERLQHVLKHRSEDLVHVLVRRGGYEPRTARRFVAVAGPDLLESWQWQVSQLDLENLPTWSNVQLLLGAIHATVIASELGIPRSEVWNGLRTFVPQVLLMADRRSHSSRSTATGSTRVARRAGIQQAATATSVRTTGPSKNEIGSRAPTS